jgi:hypothetical protein
MLVIDKNEVSKDFKKRKNAQVFRLHGARYDPELGRLSSPLSHIIPSKYSTREGDILKYVISTTETDKGKKEILGKVVFVEGELKVLPHQADLLQFLDNCPWNGSNSDRDTSKRIIFNEYNPEQEKEDEFDAIQRESDLIQEILNLEPQELKSIARGFGIHIKQPESGIRTDLINTAKINPDRFEKEMSSPELKVKSLIRNAEDLGLICLRGRVWSWNNSSDGGFIISAAKGTNPLDEFVAYLASSNEEAIEVRKILEEKVYGNKSKSKKPQKGQE